MRNERQAYQALSKEALLASIRPGDKVTVLVQNGIGLNGVEYALRSGRAVIVNPGRVALNMGGRYGKPGVATIDNLVSVRRVA